MHVDKRHNTELCKRFKQKLDFELIFEAELKFKHYWIGIT